MTIFAMQSPSSKPWQTRDRFLELHSRWMTLIGEHLQDDRGAVLEYWRIEKSDSVIVLPMQGEHLLLPAPSYRPGIGQVTWDFPGGRLPVGQHPEQAVIAILKRELGISNTAITQLLPLNAIGWAVNSSFSNQKLYGFVAQIDDTTPLLPEFAIETHAATPTGVENLLQRLHCLQCRAVLLDWWLSVQMR